MATQPQIEKFQGEMQKPRWSFIHSAGFRFCFVYFGLFCLTTQIFGSLIDPVLRVGIPSPGMLWPMRQIVFWTAVHIFGVKTRLVYMGSGSGDKTFDWVLAFCLLIITVLVAGLWSALDRRRENYIVLEKWFRLFLRFALAAQMISYGLDKVIPLQMSFPYLANLIEPYGNFSPMGVLWSSVGASPAYEIFTGCAEVIGGILLIVPRTVMVGALICLADLIEIFVLNMTYDVPVKLFSFHLILIALFLLAPEFRRLSHFFFLNRSTEPSSEPRLFSTRRANRIAMAAQIFFGALLVGMNTYDGLHAWREYGGGRVKPPLYGIWNVDEATMEGQIRPPLLTDQGRWRRVVFDTPSWIMIEFMNDSVTGYPLSTDMSSKTLILTSGREKKRKGKFTFQRMGQDQLTLDGDMDGHAVHMLLKLMDRNQFVLVKRGFHWIQEYPFNR
jgi:uncharacterized membrane protein YphA (DoxX/SURF4 family)